MDEPRAGDTVPSSPRSKEQEDVQQEQQHDVFNGIDEFADSLMRKSREKRLGCQVDEVVETHEE